MRALLSLLRASLLALCFLPTFVAVAATNVTFLRPSVPEAQYVNGLDISVKVTSPSIKSVKLSADGFAFGVPLTEANGWSINYTFSSIGKRNLVATGYDANGNAVSTTTIKMTVVNVLPTSPRAGETFGNGTPVKVSAASSVQKVALYADTFLIGQSSTRDANGQFVFKPATMSTLGSRKFGFVGYDANGKEIDRQTYAVTVQNLGLIAPKQGSSYTTGSTIEASVTAASNVARVEYYTDTSSYLATSTDAASLFKVSFKAGGVGSKVIEARAFDAAGFQIASFSVTIQVIAVPVSANAWGVWLYRFEDVAGVATTHAQLADILKKMGVARIYIKVADGSRDVLKNGYTYPLKDPSVPAAYKAAGIEPWAWAYNYPANQSSASGQGATLYAAAKSGYVGFVTDIEAEFQAESVANQMEVIKAFSTARQAAISDGVASKNFKFYETSFGQIDRQPNIAISQIDAYVDAHMPQTYSVYWGSSREADQAATIQWITDKYRARGAKKPLHHITSIERHFDGSGAKHELTAARLQTFMQKGGTEASIWALPASGDGTGEQDIPLSSWSLLKAVNWKAAPQR
jgi:Bacterial Ig domain